MKIALIFARDAWEPVRPPNRTSQLVVSKPARHIGMRCRSNDFSDYSGGAMEVYYISPGKGVAGLVPGHAAEPTPGPDQIVIRVRAISLNYRDLMVASGAYSGRLPERLIPCSDGAGEVVAVGAQVRSIRVGDRVAGCFFPTWLSGDIHPDFMAQDLGGKRNGMLAEYVAIEAAGVVTIPNGLSFQEAATLPCAGVTAWHALVRKGGIKAGDTVLTLGTGGVSTFALQFAKLHGARVIVTSRSHEKLAKARSLGADETINTTERPDWDRAVFELTAKRGVDHTIELGGAGTLERSLAATRYGGRVSLIGVLTGTAGVVNPGLILFKSLAVQGIYVGSRDMFVDMNRAMELAKLKPVVDRSLSWSEASEAYRYLESGSHFGKVVIEGKP